MPPKKKGAAGRAAKAAKAAAATPPQAEVPDTVTTSRGKEYETSAAFSRPRRESAVLQSPIEVKKKAATATPSKKRGPPAKATTKGEPPKKRGRPATKAAAQADEEEDVESEEETREAPQKRAPGRPQKVTKKVAQNIGRGRPAKKATDEVAEDEDDEDEEIDEPVPAPKPPGRLPKKGSAKASVNAATSATKKRGRPSKADLAAANNQEEEDVEESADEEKPAPKKRGRGRPAKVLKDAVPKEETGPPKKRGSSPRGGETTKIDSDDDAAADQLEDELVDSAEQDDRQYWLMKAEQEDREEQLANGEMFNAKFTIDDLKSKGAPEPWDGVRNAVAAKNMRAMKKGDLAFFYASGGKSGRKPGITGIMEIVKEHEPDQTTSDKGSYGYVENAKARDKWCVVHVEYRKKLSKPVHLSELQKFTASGGVLSDMQVLKMSRLSVTKVSEAEWKFINESLIEGFEEEDAQPGAEGANGNSIEEESTLITTDQVDGEAVVKESTQPEQDLPTDNLPTGDLPAEAVLATIESEIPSTDTIFPAETSQTSRPAFRPASRGGSRATSVKAKATTSRQGSRAGSATSASLAVPATNGRGRSRTPSVRAGSAAPANAAKGDVTAGMPAIGEDDE